MVLIMEYILEQDMMLVMEDVREQNMTLHARKIWLSYRNRVVTIGAREWSSYEQYMWLLYKG